MSAFWFQNGIGFSYCTSWFYEMGMGNEYICSTLDIFDRWKHAHTKFFYTMKENFVIFLIKGSRCRFQLLHIVISLYVYLPLSSTLAIFDQMNACLHEVMCSNSSVWNICNPLALSLLWNDACTDFPRTMGGLVLWLGWATRFPIIRKMVQYIYWHAMRLK